jgi:hypothetical protein
LRFGLVNLEGVGEAGSVCVGDKFYWNGNVARG